MWCKSVSVVRYTRLSSSPTYAQQRPATPQKVALHPCCMGQRASSQPYSRAWSFAMSSATSGGASHQLAHGHGMLCPLGGVSRPAAISSKSRPSVSSKKSRRNRARCIRRSVWRRWRLVSDFHRTYCSRPNQYSVALSGRASSCAARSEELGANSSRFWQAGWKFFELGAIAFHEAEPIQQRRAWQLEPAILLALKPRDMTAAFSASMFW
mmetsp:Transcript_34944/g.111228  ORF Transcript_34944/g.111228 Transcript_34944/m.111228 type:complete len:210 (-) Transcript_34944:191-820(-)|eukprot:scaffold28968_cov120-Isochrysis_galbana.AAC.6